MMAIMELFHLWKGNNTATGVILPLAIRARMPAAVPSVYYAKSIDKVEVTAYSGIELEQEKTTEQSQGGSDDT